MFCCGRYVKTFCGGCYFCNATPLLNLLQLQKQWISSLGVLLHLEFYSWTHCIQIDVNDGDDDDAKSIKKWIKKSDKFDVSECGKYVSLASSDKANASGDKKELKKRKRYADDDGEDGKKSAKEKKSKNKMYQKKIIEWII